MGFFTGPLTTWKLAFKEVSEERRKRETEPAKQKSWSFVTLSQKKEKKKRERERDPITLPYSSGPAHIQAVGMTQARGHQKEGLIRCHLGSCPHNTTVSPKPIPVILGSYKSEVSNLGTFY